MAPELFHEIYEHQVYHERGEIPFRHLEVLGYGSYSHVDKVEGSLAPFEGRIYARKVIRIPYPPSVREEVESSIRNEVDIIKSLRHAHVISVVGTYVCQREFGIIMTPAADENLAEYLSRVDVYPLDLTGSRLREQIVPWFGCIASAMHYLHEQNIRHRDIKPANLLVRRNNIFLTDFGIAIELAETLSTTTTIPRSRTPMYCSPEVGKGHTRGRRADMFSLGAVFLEMLTVHSGQGQLARFGDFRRSGDNLSYAGNLNRVFQWMDILSVAARSVSWHLTVLLLCRKMLQANPDQRPTAGALRLCWSYQLFSAVPPTSCKCIEGSSMALQSTRRDSLLVMQLLEDRAMFRAKDASGRTALHLAALSGHEAMVQLLLEKGANVEARDAVGATVLHVAISSGHEAMMQLLLEKGASIEARDVGGRTALHVAAADGHETLVQLLLERGANVEAKDADGRIALQVAITSAHDPVVQLLQEKAASIEPRDALHVAVVDGDEASVRLLLEKRANIEAKDAGGRTALHMAAAGERDVVMRLLLEKGSNIEAKDAGGRTALHVAVADGGEALVRLLLEKRANIEAKDAGGRTALHMAAASKREIVMRLLLEEGSSIESRDIYERTALHVAVIDGNEALVRLLLEKGANIEAKDAVERTALHMAAVGGYGAVMRLLLEKGSNIEAKDTRRRTALQVAATRGYETMVRLLLQAGADIKAKDDHGCTALKSAVMWGCEIIVRVLLEKRADIELEDICGALTLALVHRRKTIMQLLVTRRNSHETIMQLLNKRRNVDIEATHTGEKFAVWSAAMHGNVRAVRQLLDMGADINAKDQHRMTALDYAIQNGHEPVVQLLLESGVNIIVDEWESTHKPAEREE